MKHKQTDESAVALATVNEEVAEETDGLNKKQSQQSLLKTISGAVDTARYVGNFAVGVYNDWIKPVRDNWPQIKRRLSLITTLFSIIFFILYVPFLLFNKLSKELSLGWDVALYVCMGVYVLTIIALLIVALASDKSNSVAMEKKRKKMSKVILFIVRVASLALGITALIISAMEGTSDQQSAVIDTIAIIFAVMSIFFSAMPLIFGGIGGVVKWLISPAKIKFKFSFVILEWHHSFIEDQQIEKNLKRTARKYGERIGTCIDTYFLPALGDKYIKSVDDHAIKNMLESVPVEDLNICEWITKCVFDFAEDCGYVDSNPCDKLQLEGDLSKEVKIKKSGQGDVKISAWEKLAAAFSRKPKKKTIDVQEAEAVEEVEDIEEVKNSKKKKSKKKNKS